MKTTKTAFRSEFGQRLFDARKHSELTQQELAKAVGTSQANLAELEKKGTGSALTPAIANRCGVSVEWLAYGQGEMFWQQAKEPAVPSLKAVERELPSTVAERLKAARLHRKWSQADLATASGLSQGTVGNIEAGIRQSPGSQPRLAEALDVSLAWLTYGQGNMMLGQSPSKQQALLSPKALALGQLFDLISDAHRQNEAFAAVTCAILSFVDNRVDGGGGGEDSKQP
jgi:transcriptional regulator with XRE-family HTH domain